MWYNTIYTLMMYTSTQTCTVPHMSGILYRKLVIVNTINTHLNLELHLEWTHLIHWWDTILASTYTSGLYYLCMACGLSCNPSVSTHLWEYVQIHLEILFQSILAVDLIKGAHHTPMSPLVKRERMFDLFMEALVVFRWVVLPIYRTGSLSVLLYCVSCLQLQLIDIY